LGRWVPVLPTNSLPFDFSVSRDVLSF